MMKLLSILAYSYIVLMLMPLVKEKAKMNEKIIERADGVSNILKVLSNKNRLLIVCFLIDESKTVSEINSEVPLLSQSAVSQHLRILKASNIVTSRRSGMNINYEIKDKRIISLIKCLRDTFCE